MSDLTDYAKLINQQTQANNSWSAQQAQNQMNFQREMSDTAHQREVADLKAAGLNPVLSANAGASTPNGAMGETDSSGVAALASVAVELARAANARELAELKYAGSAAGSAAGSTSVSARNTYYSKTGAGKFAQDVVEGMLGMSVQEAAKAIGSAIINSGKTSWNLVKESVAETGRLPVSGDAGLSSRYGPQKDLKKGGYSSLSDVKAKQKYARAVR